MKCLMLATLLLLAAVPEMSAAATITVRRDGSGDFATLQPALDAAADGDTVLVGPGEYTESTMVRLGANGFDQEVYGRIAAANVTVIGAGVGATIIGPAAYSGSPGELSPVCIAMDAGNGWLRISDITMRNCYVGLHVDGILGADRCEILDNYGGVVWATNGSGGWVKDTNISASAPQGVGAAIDVGVFPSGSGITVENCYLGWPCTVRGVQNFMMRDCEFNGLSLYDGASVFMERCIGMLPYGGVGMTLGGGAYCEIRDSELRRGVAPLVIDFDAPGSRFVVENTLIEGGSYAGVYLAGGAGPCEIHNCDLVKGSGPMVQCFTSTALVTHNLSNNYWGTTDEATIQSWIIDRSDDSNIGATVIYSPFAGQSVPTESTSWGDLKAFWR